MFIKMIFLYIEENNLVITNFILNYLNKIILYKFYNLFQIRNMLWMHRQEVNHILLDEMHIHLLISNGS